MAIERNTASTRADATRGRDTRHVRYELEEGNARWVNHSSEHPRQDRDRRRELLDGQNPPATVLGCADSRVPPELVFDQGLGDLFTIRAAGPVLDESVLGSLVLGVEDFDTGLIVVLGHERCGVVEAAVRAHRTGDIPDGPVGYVVERVLEVVETVPHDPDPNAFLDACVRANARHVVRELVDEPRLREAVVRHGVRIEPAYYDLGRHRVEWLGNVVEGGRAAGVPLQRPPRAR